MTQFELDRSQSICKSISCIDLRNVETKKWHRFISGAEVGILSCVLNGEERVMNYLKMETNDHNNILFISLKSIADYRLFGMAHLIYPNLWF